MDTTNLLLSLLFSSIGMGYFIYGKRQQRAVPLLVGVGLMVYPYFVANAWAMAGMGVALMAVPYFIAL